MNRIDKYVKEKRVFVVIVDENDYTNSAIGLFSSARRFYKRVCYVSLNKPCTTLSKEMNEYGVGTENVFFIDAVTENVNDVEDSERIKYVSSPRALTELSIALKKTVEENDIEFVVFDSLSTLLIYEGSAVVVKFVHSIVSDIRVRGSGCAFLMITDDASENAIKDISMFVDAVL